MNNISLNLMQRNRENNPNMGNRRCQSAVKMEKLKNKTDYQFRKSINKKIKQLAEE